MANYYLRKTRLGEARKKQIKHRKRTSPFNNGLFLLAIALIVLGLIFTYSSSAFDSLAYFKRQLIFDIIGGFLMFTLIPLFTKIRKQKWFRADLLLFGSWGLLIWALFSPETAHTHRWINLGFFNLQPSEIAKVLLILYLATYFSLKPVSLRKEKEFIAPLVYSVITIGLIYLGKDIGIPVLLVVVAFSMFMIAGAPLKKICIMGACCIPLGVCAIIAQPYRLQRIIDFITFKAGYQVQLSFYAVGSGGLFGKGFGASDLKLEYLPAAHTDFIFSIICEEGGLFVALCLLGCFIWILYRGFGIANRNLTDERKKDKYNGYLVFGLSLCLCLQAFINMSVAIGAAPTKGLPLPFFSYGGSSVIVTLVMIGILVNLYNEEEQSNE